MVDRAIHEVHAMTAGPSAQSTAERAWVSSTPNAPSLGTQLQQPRLHPGTKVSSLKNLVGDGSKQGSPVADSEQMRASTASLSLGADHLAEQQQEIAQLSQRNRGIRLMTAEGASSAAQLLSAADLAAASSEPRQAPSASTMQPGRHAGVLQAAAARRPPAGTTTLEASSSAASPSTAEQALSGSATAVLVGEDEEFSVSSGDPEHCPAQSAHADLRMTLYAKKCMLWRRSACCMYIGEWLCDLNCGMAAQMSMQGCMKVL